jgi:hypothetical protein
MVILKQHHQLYQMMLILINFIWTHIFLLVLQIHIIKAEQVNIRIGKDIIFHWIFIRKIRIININEELNTILIIYNKLKYYINKKIFFNYYYIIL